MLHVQYSTVWMVHSRQISIQNEQQKLYYQNAINAFSMFFLVACKNIQVLAIKVCEIIVSVDWCLLVLKRRKKR